jgi:hypothetical protein
MNLERTGGDNNGNERKEFFEFRQKIETEFPFRKDMVEDEHIRRIGRDLRQGFAAVLDTNEMILCQGLLVDLVLEVVVFDDKDAGGGHSEVQSSTDERRLTSVVDEAFGADVSGLQGQGIGTGTFIVFERVWERERSRLGE